MALTSVNGTLYCAARGRDTDTDNGVYVARLTGTTWSGFTQIPGYKTNRAPALAAKSGRLPSPSSVWAARSGSGSTTAPPGRRRTSAAPPTAPRP
ncbi:hypothetical protein [Embleya sp. NBC_00896]|uniref:hypothetical protein n=1 Tax=Embleya sp. NBC_00896 TaxID=2975961 RepID=UPI00386448F4|nr:hypothetical protein OG928_06100 [Embleya sp. NBC_00896]